MATPFFTPALEDIGPDAGPKADAAPAGRRITHHPHQIGPPLARGQVQRRAASRSSAVPRAHQVEVGARIYEQPHALGVPLNCG